MPMGRKAYLEITNDCNLACSFCHGTRRPVRYMGESEFVRCAAELRPITEYLYFHLMGEPLLHPRLTDFLSVAHGMDYKVILTTNGSLLAERGKELISSPGLYKVSISLHAYEVNMMAMTLDEYLDSCFDFCEAASRAGIISVMRLWNAGGEDSLNPYILERMHERFPGDWQELYSGYRIEEKLFLEWGERFEWPDEDADECGSHHSCYGLRDQVGVLSDGTVVPCCLDAEGVINLGNLFKEPISEILSRERARALIASFEKRDIKEPLCTRCDFAKRRFSKERKYK